MPCQAAAEVTTWEADPAPPMDVEPEIDAGVTELVSELAPEPEPFAAARLDTPEPGASEAPAQTEASVEMPFEPESMIEPAWPEQEEAAVDTAESSAISADNSNFLRRDPVREESFLTRDELTAADPVPAPESTTDTASQFLRPVGIRNIAEVEVPDTEEVPPPVNRSASAGLGPVNPADDRNTPAYIRKYMD